MFSSHVQFFESLNFSNIIAKAYQHVNGTQVEAH